MRNKKKIRRRKKINYKMKNKFPLFTNINQYNVVFFIYFNKEISKHKSKIQMIPQFNSSQKKMK